jgi:hypothetical protein
MQKTKASKSSNKAIEAMMAEAAQAAADSCKGYEIRSDYYLLKDLLQLAVIGCSNEEIAVLVDWPVETLERYFAEDLNRIREEEKPQSLRQRMKYWLARQSRKRN